MTSSYKSTPTGYGYFIIALFSMIYGPILGQLNLTFDQGMPLSGEWVGDIQHFKVNDAGMLQLNSSAAGVSEIFTKYRIPSDSLHISLYFRMDFAPSNENMAKIWLMTNKSPDDTVTGYYLKLGENGSQDAIQWWKADQGQHRLLAAGKMGGISIEPATARVLATWHASGLCIMATDYDGNTFFEEDALFSDGNILKSDSVWFGIQCKYSSSRKDKFYFDDIHIVPLTKDTSPPLVVSVKTVGDYELQVEFSEFPTMESAGNPDSYQIFPQQGHPDEVVFPCGMRNRACLRSKNPLISGLSGVLHVTGLKDDKGNHTNQKIPFVHATKPMPGDLVITEILTHPFSGGEDFLELYNPSEKLLLLDSIVLENSEKQESRMIRSNFFLEPGKYMAISSDTLSLKNLYATPDSARFMQAILPTLNVESAIVKMYTFKEGYKKIIDSMRYHEDMHTKLLISSKGVSLEKIQPSGLSWDTHNWHSASSVNGYGTPGYKNSVSISETTVENCDFCISTDKKIFSPDGDGFDDYLAIHYRMKKPGCKASISLFDGEGYAVGTVGTSYLLGTEGLVIWDGDVGTGKALPSGIYILVFRWIHPDGEVGVSRHAIVVARRN